MIKKTPIFLIVIFSSYCVPRSDRSTENNIFDDFNASAKNAILKNFAEYDLYPMRDLDRCILKEAISKYLDEMNSYKLVRIDSFLIRNYWLEDLGCRFSIVSTKNNFYFLFLPRLYDYVNNDDKYQDNDTIYQLRSPDYAIARINSATFDKFIEQEVFVKKGNPVTHERADQLMREIFPELTYTPCQADDLTQWIRQQPYHNREVIERELGGILKRKPLFDYARDFTIFKVEYLGYFLFDYHIDDDVSLNVLIDIYFMPYNERFGTSFGTDEKKFVDCFKQ